VKKERGKFFRKNTIRFSQICNEKEKVNRINKNWNSFDEYSLMKAILCLRENLLIDLDYLERNLRETHKFSERIIHQNFCNLIQNSAMNMLAHFHDKVIIQIKTRLVIRGLDRMSEQFQPEILKLTLTSKTI
jgi:hypothetical protein